MCATREMVALVNQCGTTLLIRAKPLSAKRGITEAGAGTMAVSSDRAIHEMSTT